MATRAGPHLQVKLPIRISLEGALCSHLPVVSLLCRQFGWAISWAATGTFKILKLDAKQKGDAVTIDDLLDTSMLSVDLQLGSRKATMWQADRAFGGQYQVYPADYEAFANDLSVRQSAYFYRYDLAEGGQYLFNQDGSPRLEEVVTGAGAPISHEAIIARELDNARSHWPQRRERASREWRQGHGGRWARDREKPQPRGRRHGPSTLEWR